MHNHKHDHCCHDLKHCTCCDVAYCTKCGKEWGKERIVYSNPWAYTYLNSGTPLKVTCGGTSGVTCLTGGAGATLQTNASSTLGWTTQNCNHT